MVSANTVLQYQQLTKESGLTTEQINDLYRTLNHHLSLPKNQTGVEGPGTHGKAWETWFHRFLDDAATIEELWSEDKQIVWKLPDHSSTITYFLRAATLNAASLIRKGLRKPQLEAARSVSPVTDGPSNEDTPDLGSDEGSFQTTRAAALGLSQENYIQLCKTIRRQLNYSENRIGLEGPASGGPGWDAWFQRYLHSEIADQFWGEDKGGVFQFPRDKQIIGRHLSSLVLRLASSKRNWARKSKFPRRTVSVDESRHTLSNMQNAGYMSSDDGRTLKSRETGQESMNHTPPEAPISMPSTSITIGKRPASKTGGSSAGQAEKRWKPDRYRPGGTSSPRLPTEPRTQIRNPSTATHSRGYQSTSLADPETTRNPSLQAPYRGQSPPSPISDRPPDTFTTYLFTAGNTTRRKELIEVAGLISLPTFIELFRKRHEMDPELRIDEMKLEISGRTIDVDLYGPEGEFDWGLAMGILYFSGVPEGERLFVRVWAR